MLEEELAALEAFWQLLAYGLLDHARTGEADQCTRLADDHVAEHRQAGGNAAVDRVGQYRDERDAFLAQARQYRGGLGHLHQRDQRFLHARTTGGREADHRAAVFQGIVGRADEALTNDGAHGTTHEGEFEGADHDRHAQQGTAHGDQRVFLAGLLLGGSQAVLVLLAIAELQAVDRLQVGPQLGAAFGIQEDVNARTRANAHVVVALGADIQGLFQLRTIEHRFTGRALVPQPLGNRAFLHLGTHDRRDQFVY
ncbi:hypothetical protein D9M71_543590 [compost metagenome]